MGRRAERPESKAEAKQPLAAKAAKKAAARVHELEKRLAESLERETATSEILRVISSSPTDVQPVFDTIAVNALRLCAAAASAVLRFDGELIHVVSLQNINPEATESIRQAFPMPPNQGGAAARAILTRDVVYIPDVGDDPEYQLHGQAKAVRYRSILSVPMLREGVPIGAINVTGAEAGMFSPEQVALLRTFADQAVIAIENARLFNELEARNRDLTATSEILGTIASSPTDVQPVFDTIAASAKQLCNGFASAVYRFDGTLIHLAAYHNWTDQGLALIRGLYPRAPSPETLMGATIMTRSVIQVRDFETDADLPAPLLLEPLRSIARAIGYRSQISVPMLREGNPIGAVTAVRTAPGPFPTRQVELLQTFAAQAVIAIENVRLFTELQASNRELTTALETQSATSDILRVISRSQTDVQPVFDAIVHSAVRLLGGYASTLTRLRGDQVELAANTSTDTAGDAALRTFFPQPLHRGGAHVQAIRDRVPLNIADSQTDPRLPGVAHAFARVRGYRSQVVVPLLRHDEAIGAIGVSRREPGGFTDDEIALLKTFADQAVIAIENARLLSELQARNEALTHAYAQVSEALDQQTATSEILRVISRSQTDVQPVFDTIVQSAVRLCDGLFSALYRFDGEMLHHVAQHNYSPEALEEIRRIYPMRPTRGSGGTRAILERTVVHIPDIEVDPEFEVHGLSRAIGARSSLFVPMLREGAPIGVIGVARAEAGPFSDSEIELLKTFADQAVIAIENVRLFTELQASNRELTTALDTQTATSDILRVISRSQTDVQPVFDAIVVSAVHLLGAYVGALTRIAGDQIEMVALTGTDAAGDATARVALQMSLQSEQPHAQAIRDRVPLNIADTETDPRVPETARAAARVRGFRSWVVVPMLHHNEAIGTIGVTRREPGGFDDDEIALLQTFADQAVIAIENARLLSELQARTQELTRSVDQLTALGDVGRAVSSSLDLDTVLTTIVGRAVQLSGADGGTIFEYDEGTEEFAPRATLNADESQSAMLRATRLRRGEGAVGQMAVTREPIQIPDIAEEGAYESRLRGALLGAGTRALLAIPLLHEERIVGGLVVSRRTPGEFTVEVVEILRTFATQSALAIQNARLFKEIEVKSRELEAASKHKSEFLANMSHELRTPLNAIIGYSEMLQEEAADLGHEPLVPDLQKINAAAKHLLSLINDILDLSKVEAGRMELEWAAFDLPATIDDTMLLMRERAGRRGIGLERHVEAGVGQIRADERKVKQVLLNLLSNAVKFTPEGGQVGVHAALVDGRAQISVTDTGVGIATEDQEAVFEEFRQVGTADKKAEGTGLGLALCRKFVELHGGRIWVTSQIGAGSTFTFTLPLGQ